MNGISKKETFTCVNILVILFVTSLALGTFNPFYRSQSEDGGIGLANIMTIIVLPILLKKYGGTFKSMLVFNDWQSPLIVFYCISLISVLIMASSITMGLIIDWVKLLMGIMICILLPSVYRNKTILNLSLLSYSITCSIICTLILAGSLSSYHEVHHGRLWLWGENPNSTSTRWVLAVIYIVNIVVENPLKIGKWRFMLLPAIIPLVMLIMMSGSRGSFVIAIIAITMSLLTVIRKNIGITIAMIGVAYIIFTFIVSNFDVASYSLFDRFVENSISDEDDIRNKLLKASWKVFCDYPIIGCGQVDYISEMMKYGHDHYVHNVFIHVLTINGILGFIPLIFFTYILFKGSLSVVRKNGLALVLFCYMILIANKTGGALTYIFMWFVYGLVAALVNNVLEDKIKAGVSKYNIKRNKISNGSL